MKLYKEKEIGAILKKAAENSAGEVSDTSVGLSIVELKQLASDAGIDPGQTAKPFCYFVFSNTVFRYAAIVVPQSATPFVIANLLVFLVAAVSLSMQSYRLVNVIPADVLRYD